ncbi:MAG: ABC transporter ATP-binding protein [Alphaproteobacteria bacterium]
MEISQELFGRPQALILGLARAFWPFFAIMGVWSLTWASFMVATPFIFKLIVNSINSPSQNTAVTLSLLTLAYVSAQEALNVCWRIWDIVSLRYSQRIYATVTSSAYHAILGRDMRFFDERNAGQIAKLVSDIGDSFTSLVGILDSTATRLVGIVFSSIFLAAHNIYYGAVFLVWSAVFITLSYRFTARNSVLAADTARHYSERQGILTDIISNIDTVKYFGSTSSEESRLDRSIDDFQKSERLTKFNHIKNQYILGLSVSLLIAGLLFVLLTNFAAGKASAGEAVFVLTVSLNMVWEVWNIGTNIVRSSTTIGSLSAALKVVGEKEERSLGSQPTPSLRGPNTIYPATQSGDAVQICNVSVAYGQERLALDGVNLSVEAGELVAIVGESGAGKTTLTKALTGLVGTSRGRILVLGRDVTTLSPSEIANAITVVPQQPRLFNRTVRENLEYGGRVDSAWTTDQLLHHKAFEFISALPNGLDTLAGALGGNLSGGERQRVAIARSILRDTPIVIFDEPTSALDPVTNNHIMELISDTLRGKTRIIITHQMQTAQECGRVVVLSNGRVVGDGTHDALLRDCPPYKAMWRQEH